MTDTEPDLKELCRPPSPKDAAGVWRFYTQNHKLKCYRTRPGRVNKGSIRERTVGERGRGGPNFFGHLPKKGGLRFAKSGYLSETSGHL